MRIVLTAAGIVRLEAAEDFGRLSVVIEPQPEAAAQRVLGSISQPCDEGHVWIHPEVLRTLAGRRDADWQEGLSQMAAFAQSRGWTNPAGAFRVHLERPTSAEAPLGAEAFRAAMRNLAGAVSVVATGDGDARHGITVSSLTSLCAEPPCLLVCVNARVRGHDPLIANGTFSASVLAEEQGDLALRFAGMDGVKGAARFDEGAWETGATGAPRLKNAIAGFDCTVLSHQTVGTHSLIIGRIEAAVSGEGRPLVNFQGRMQPLAG
ncbi:MAG: flavin reductase [Rhodobacteraceae bacterium]|nr:flavin reductase [Paracoccaceae bacterium]